ncbi:hypothetical protein A5N15_09405 [Rothia kristinae]|uniref:Ferric enterobactin transport system permease protein fepD n=1 Tax=Rothia kristinae TaxID=37923 RepID=A0A657IU12_9MICC|nr:hypothetical protein A5N15_09405 [Rothia kristinae]
MQGVTRNPLGDPGILGINAGAAATVVLGITLLGISGTMAIAVWALIGAGLAAVVVYAIASIGREGATPIKLALVGAAFSAGAASLTSAMNLQHQETLDSFRRWQLGALTRASYADVLILLPLILLGLLLTVGMARSVNSFALGDDMARALGTRVGPARALVFAGVDPPVRGGRGPGRAHRLRRAHGPARGALADRPGLPVDPAAERPGRSRGAAAGRRRRAGGAAADRGGGGGSAWPSSACPCSWR